MPKWWDVKEPEEELITVKEFANALRMKQETVWALVRADVIPAIRLPTGTIRIRKAVLDQYLNAPQEQSDG